MTRQQRLTKSERKQITSARRERKRAIDSDWGQDEMVRINRNIRRISR